MEKINQLRKYFKNQNIDGYIIPKNNNFFGEYTKPYEDNLKYISNFSGSSGFAIILKKKNYIFVDGRYTLQANRQCSNKFKIFTIPHKYPYKVFKKKINLGFDPRLHTENSLKRIFGNSPINLKPINKNLIDLIWKRNKNIKPKTFYVLNKKDVGSSKKEKISRLLQELRVNKADYIFSTASENIAWLLNIRGCDDDYSPLPHAHILIDKIGNIKLFCDLKKITKSLKRVLNKKMKIYEFNYLNDFISTISNKRILIDSLTCSFFLKLLIKKNNTVLEKPDPIYYLKSLKNKTEIQNTIKSHVYDGAALTKFIFWIKNNYKQKKISEIKAQNKLYALRKKNKSFKSLSFPTISGSGPNSAIIHYKADKKTNRLLRKGDIYLVDSGGQYSFGTTDVTRTLSLNNRNKKIKTIFTLVLKGHIAVSSFELNEETTGDKIDIKAREPLKSINLDYPHGTGHGVGYFLNVHEGPVGISRSNKVKFKEGMITSNEPGFYKKNFFGIRIENLIYVEKVKKKLRFRDLTLAPIEKDLIDKKLLNSKEIEWLNNYHNQVYISLKKYMNRAELIDLKKACSNI